MFAVWDLKSSMHMGQDLCSSGRFAVHTIGRFRMNRVAVARCGVIVMGLIGRDSMVRG